MEPLGLAMLPDDEMVQILRYLSAPELLKCRAVCRRWRDLALHPQLWRRFTVSSCSPHFGAVLRLVPFVRGLRVGHPSRPTDPLCMLLAMDTKCAASELHMVICNTLLLVLGALIVRRQATLGRLREVRLSLHLLGHKKPTACIHTLLQEVHAVKGLVKLKIDGYGYGGTVSLPKLPKTAVVSRGPVEPSLRYLSFDLYNDLELAKEHLLPLVANHSTTLEELLSRSHHPELAGLLATAPRLRKITCPMLDGMEALERCPSLTSLHLFVDFGAHAMVASRWASVMAFLRVATLKLTSLRLEMFAYQEPAELDSLLLSLGGTPGFPMPSTLQCLALDFCPGDVGKDRKMAKNFPPLGLRSLAAVLPRLSNLRHLKLDAAPSAEFLDAISPQALPALGKLVMFSSEGCSHEWFHTGVLAALLKRNPSLHAVVGDAWCTDVLEEERHDCTFCVNECQPRCPNSFWRKQCWAVFFSHSETDDCEFKEIHNTASKWMKV